MKTLLDDFAPMVPQLCEMLGQMYSTIPQASAIDLTRQVGTRVELPLLGRLGGCRTASVLLRCLLQLVHIFAHEPAHFPPIKALFLLVTSVTLTLFQQGMCDELLVVLGLLSGCCMHGVWRRLSRNGCFHS